MRLFKSILFYILVIAICLIIISPFIILISYSLRSSDAIFALDTKLLPRKLTFAAYKNVILSYNVGGSTFVDWARNSLIVCGSSTTVSVFIAAMCGYAISRFRFYGKRILWFLNILTQSVPWVVLLIPYYMLFARVGMVDRLSMLFLTYVAIFVPVSTWLFTGFFSSIPRDIEDAAKIDGCGPWHIFLRIVMPMSLSSVSAIALFTFVLGWGDYLLSSVIIKSGEKWTLPIGIVSYRGHFDIQWAEIMAISVIVTVPIAGLFAYLQKNLVNLIAGGVKE